MVKNLPANAEDADDAGDTDSNPGSGKSPREGNGNLLLYSLANHPVFLARESHEQRNMAVYSPWGHRVRL